MELARIVAAWVLLALIASAGAIVVVRMARGDIDLKKLVSEPDGDASMGRFQLLIFTFVVALSVFYVTVAPESSGLPEIPVGLLTLMGVSASSYGVGKLLQTHRDTELRKTDRRGADRSDSTPVKAGQIPDTLTTAKTGEP